MQNSKQKSGRGYKTREKLYDAALSLFEEKGYENTTIEDITERAGTAKGTFYVHFDSKSDLIYHTVERYDEVSKNAYANVQNLPTFKEQLTAYMRLSNIDVKTMGKEILRALYINNILGDELIITRPTREVYYSMRRIVEFGLKTGELSDKHPVDFYVNMIVLCNLGVDYYWCSGSAGEEDNVALATTLSEVLADGMMNINKAK